jgi:hypothetical protein
MIKALSAITVAALVAAAVALLPGFAPKVEARVPAPLLKSDRLDIRPARVNCAAQTWPHIDASCLRRAGSKTAVTAVRVVGAKG